MQSIALGATIAVSVAAFTALLLLGGGVYQGIELNAERSGAQILIVPTEAESELEDTDILYTGAPVGAYMDASIADQVKEIEGVDDVTSQFYGQTLAAACCSADGATKIVGFDPTTDWVIKPFALTEIEGDLADDEVVVGYNVTGYARGTGKVLGHDVKVKAFLAETGTYLDNCLFMSNKAVRALSKETQGFDHLWEKYGDADNLCSAILVKCDEEKESSIAGKIKRYVKGDYSTIVQSSVLNRTQKSFDIIFGVMLGCALTLIVASILQLIARFSTLVWDRRSELALFRALGATKSNLSALICGEAFLLTGIGSVIGCGLGYCIFLGMIQALQYNTAFPFNALSPLQTVGGILAIVAVFFLITLLSIIPPLRQSSSIDPASAMNQVDIG
ncbi:MAG: ABC transporter permease [Phoenicibacter congonensis]|uniref:ABC transporter permease n=1 Tax=Phoenicibacter congonensis TaxID=1944646 RepID=A0AA43UB33_9ACTN|nr:ABC transporter permease [Phoenicibacter congonensis]